MSKNNNKEVNEYFLLVKDLLERHKLTVKKINYFPEYSTIQVSFMAKQFNFIIWHKRISSADEYLKLHKISEKNDQNWIIITKSLATKSKNKQYIDKMEEYANDTNKYIKILTFDEYHIIEFLKELFFDDYAKSKGIISHPEKELFLCFMNHNTKVFDGTVINYNHNDWNKNYKKFFYFL
ncbi:22385_t:CDS:1 [Gigaspora margarita]|uniref:22385_t:CDS:1 n=1 Tax=Gigaspora margarita TaxID=4874 RepID=A0ABN7UPC8_GIGMA|nr:22385_t:CDS:1 [Gigaspora margarita]